MENEEIFADKVCVVEQDSATPAFDGNPTRSGYTFMGRSPAVTETVTADVTYAAQWKRIYRPTPSTPTVEIPDDDALGLNPGDWFYLAMQEATNSHDYTLDVNFNTFGDLKGDIFQNIKHPVTELWNLIR